jgi:hypothetical protein
MRKAKLVVTAVLLLAAGAVAPALGTMKCFSFIVRVCDNYQCCSSRCTQCNYYDANGDWLGESDWCSDIGCTSTVN